MKFLFKELPGISRDYLRPVVPGFVAGAAVTSVSITRRPPTNLTIESATGPGSLSLRLQASRELPPGNYGGDVVVTTEDGQTYSLPWLVKIVNR